MTFKRRTQIRVAKAAGKGMIEHPTFRHAATSVAVPVAKRRIRTRSRRARRQAEHYSQLAQTTAGTLAQSAQQLGLLETPTPKRTGPRVAIGVVIGAAAMYLLEPTAGEARRAKLVAVANFATAPSKPGGTPPPPAAPVTSPQTAPLGVS